MNRMELVPDDAPEWAYIQRLEQRGRCAYFVASLTKLRRIAQETRAEDLPQATKHARLLYLHHVCRKLAAQHRETHLCYPFSIN